MLLAERECLDDLDRLLPRLRREHVGPQALEHDMDAARHRDLLYRPAEMAVQHVSRHHRPGLDLIPTHLGGKRLVERIILNREGFGAQVREHNVGDLRGDLEPLGIFGLLASPRPRFQGGQDEQIVVGRAHTVPGVHRESPCGLLDRSSPRHRFLSFNASGTMSAVAIMVACRPD